MKKIKRVCHLPGLTKWSVGLDSWFNNFEKVKFLHHQPKSSYYYKLHKLKKGIDQAEGRQAVEKDYAEYLICHDTTNISAEEKNKIIKHLEYSDFVTKYPMAKVVKYNPKIHDNNSLAIELPFTFHIFAGDSNEANDLIAVPVLGEGYFLLT